MHGVLPANPQRSIFAGDSSVTEKPFSDSSVTDVETKWFSALAERLWPSKAAAALDHLTSADLRQCYRYASGRHQPPATLLVELLRGADGERVLDDLMRGSKAAWWADLDRDRRQAATARDYHQQFQLL